MLRWHFVATTVVREGLMEIKELQRELMLTQIIVERDGMILDLNNQVLQLKQENEKYKQIVNDLDKKEK